MSKSAFKVSDLVSGDSGKLQVQYLNTRYPSIVSTWDLVYKASVLTNCIPVDYSTVICWTSPFVILGVLGLFCHFYYIFDGKSC